MLDSSSDLARFIKLGWEILEHKCKYYILNKPTVTDYEYDIIEKEYDALADKLGLDKSASDMVDFDTKRPACQSVMRKLGVSGKRKRKKK